MLEQILLLLGLPIVLGILFAHYFPNATKKIIKPSQGLSVLLFVGMVIVSFAQNFQIFIDTHTDLTKKTAGKVFLRFVKLYYFLPFFLALSLSSFESTRL